MSAVTLIITYLLGGLTFLPTLLAAILIPGWLLLPQKKNWKAATDDNKREKGEEDDILGDTVPEVEYFGEGAASATFAVLRSYQFSLALAALNARNSNPASGDPPIDGTTEKPSGSVYQNVYRSVFKSGNPTSALAESESASPTTSARTTKKVEGSSVFFIVLRHGHLMLYDSSAQLEVRHVISLASYAVSLSDGSSYEDHGERVAEGDLFIKRTAIVLTPLDLPDGALQAQTARRKPFYLFSSTCSEKEDFYHALLSTRIAPPVPQTLAPGDTIKLQSLLHSTSLTPETRAFNALLGRIFLGIHRTLNMETFVRDRIEKKIARVQKPTFIAALAVKSIDLGNAAPVLSNPRLRDLNVSGDMTLAFDLRYNGGIKVVISAVAKLDLGTRFKTRTLNLVLATSLQRLQAHMLVRVKPAPSNRIWFCFESMPEMDIKVEPVVSQRQITYNFILRAIEERIRTVVAETLVKPNWDDVPFFDTTGQRVRGGIWKDEGLENEASSAGGTLDSRSSDPRASELLATSRERMMSMPVLPINGDGDFSAASSGSEDVSRSPSTASIRAAELASTLKRRSVVSLPPENIRDPSHHETRPVPKPLRSPSFATPSPSVPSVALDDASIASAHTEELPREPKRWRTAPLQQSLRKDAVETVREVRDRSLRHRESVPVGERRTPTTPTTGDVRAAVKDALSADIDPRDTPTGTVTGERLMSTDEDGRAQRPPPTDREASSSLVDSLRVQQSRKTILGATAAATAAARSWGWNAIANRNKSSLGFRGGNPPADLPGQPIGRGQPLPPPGVPLPGPQKSLWNASGLGGSGVVKRKPILPPRRTLRDVNSFEKPEQSVPSRESTSQDTAPVVSARRETVEDEFGPWRQNSGHDREVGLSESQAGLSVMHHAASVQAEDMELEAGGESTAKDMTESGTLPPLPARPAVSEDFTPDGDTEWLSGVEPARLPVNSDVLRLSSELAHGDVVEGDPNLHWDAEHAELHAESLGQLEDELDEELINALTSNNVEEADRDLSGTLENDNTMGLESERLESTTLPVNDVSNSHHELPAAKEVEEPPMQQESEVRQRAEDVSSKTAGVEAGTDDHG